MSEQKAPWPKRVFDGLVLLVVIAVGARVVYRLLVPLLPVVGAGVVLYFVYSVITGMRRH